tara:strand:+ start:404 stop:586 length:183 start_codon:yes stop_codon:yes gene_type:complete
MNIEPLWIKVKITYLDFNDHGGGLAQYAMILEGESLEDVQREFYGTMGKRQVDAFFEVAA